MSLGLVIRMMLLYEALHSEILSLPLSPSLRGLRLARPQGEESGSFASHFNCDVFSHKDFFEKLILFLFLSSAVIPKVASAGGGGSPSFFVWFMTHWNFALRLYKSISFDFPDFLDTRA
ncbi:hypothetical protein Tco_0601548 [Tanacetum coccineum]